MKYEDIQNEIQGPVPSFRTPFTQEGEIDWGSIPKVVEAALSGRPRCLLLTAGDSHFECLSEKEIAEVTRRVCDIAAGRTLVVTADFQYATRRAIEFAEFCRSCGSRVFMSLPPDWQSSCSAETLAAHYAAVAEALPVMIVTNRFRTRGDAFGLTAIRRAFERSERIVSIKEDLGGRFACDVAQEFSSRCAVMAGGSKRLHILMRPYGLSSYLSLFMNLYPELAWAYWEHTAAGRFPEAEEIFRRKEIPLFAFLAGQRASFDAGIHALYEIHGLGRRWRRPPYTNFTDEEVRRLGDLLASLDLLPDQPCLPS
ncbi:MAG TPA: dihydrodipicolinate synthase family protein [Terrimicrobiaceae bacterium]|nr:dihydrodipicolinate synthase family protein [Terrimicrobiaceae bacterium]